MDSQKNKIMAAVLISLAMHVIFFAVSRHIVLPGSALVGNDPQKIFRIKKVDKTPEEMKLFKQVEKKTTFPDREESEPLVESVMLEQAATVLVEQKDLAFERKKEKEAKEQETLETKTEKIKVEDLAKVSEQQAREKLTPAARVLNDVVLSKGPSSFSSAPRIQQDDAEYDENLPDPGDIDENAILSDYWKDVSAVSGESTPGKALERVGRYEDMTSYLDVRLRTYQNPSTGEKFFRANVGVKKGVRIEPMPKEVVFLVDTSKSITDIRFEQVKRGLSDILKGFDEKDTFNIIAFKNEREQFSPSTVKATAANIRGGRDFINTLAAEGRTNIEEALLSIIRSPAKKKPSYVVLISDGRPTAGITGAREIIRAVTRTNMGRKPVFSFGAGLRVNTYFLDFISYQNRAWSDFAIARDSVTRDLGRFYNDISAPLLTDVRYRMSGMESKEVFPKELPDFFHSRGITVYGKYWDEDKFSMQVLGEIDGVVKEFIFERKLSDAEQGDKDIERGWAFNKIYHNIGKDTMGTEDPEVIKGEIEFLSKEYGINIPHLEEEIMVLPEDEE